jgi:hypothetical protein
VAAQTAKERRKIAILEGTHAFRRILYDYKFSPLSSFAEVNDDPSQTLLVILGNSNGVAQVRDELLPFVRRGGGLLIATDRTLGGREIDRLTGVVVADPDWGQVYGPPDRSYRQEPDCPFAEPANGADPNLFRTVPAGTLRHVATNIPGRLIPTGPFFPRGIRPLAVFPRGSRVVANAIGRRPTYLAVGGQYGRGQVLLLADHSIFINMMMLPSDNDNDNVDFTYNVVAWFRGNPVRRNRVLFVENGEIQTKLDIPVKDVDIPAEELIQAIYAQRNRLLVEAEKHIARMEDGNSFNVLFYRVMRKLGVSPSWVMAVLFSLLSFGLLGYVGYRAGVRNRFRTEPALTSLERALSQNRPVGPAIDGRHQSLLQGDNLWETARALARQWFLEQGVPEPPYPPGELDPPPPRVEVEGSWWQRWRMRRRIQNLWQLAYHSSPRRMPARKLRPFLAELEDLRNACAQKDIHFPASRE